MPLIQPGLPLQAKHNKQARFVYIYFNQEGNELIREAMSFLFLIPYRVHA